MAALIQPVSGDLSAKNVAEQQPVKLAAMESVFHTQRHAGLVIGGVPDVQQQTLSYGIEVPGMLSYMAYGDFNAEVQGLDKTSVSDRPPVAIVHYAFQVMVGLGMAMFLVAVVYFISLWRKRTFQPRAWLLRCFAYITPAGFIAVEAGWTVTEVGRQPWIIQGVMRTKDAVTPMPGIVYSFYLFSALYISLAFFVCFLLYRQISMVGKTYSHRPDKVNG